MRPRTSTRAPGGPEAALDGPAPGEPDRAGRSPDPGAGTRAGPAWAAAAWIGGALVLFACLFRISLSSPVTSDGANDALLGWDMLHGNVLLHGWIIADVTYYTFELPLYAIGELLIGLQTATSHVAAALTYLIVVAFAVAVARTGSRGLAAAARCGVVVAVMAAALVTLPGVAVLLEQPDHFGTSAFLLGSFLLIDRAAGWRFTSPLLGVILCVGQVGDATVRYIAVPAILLVCAYRIVAARKIRTNDTAMALAAAVSVPLASLIRAVMVHFGAYAMTRVKNGIAPPGEWPHHAALTLRALLTLFGATFTEPRTLLSTLGATFGLICLLAAAFGFGRVVWTWRSASRAEQLLCVAIVLQLAVYTVSTLSAGRAYDVAAVLPGGAVLAARACVPERIARAPRARARVVLAAAAVAALIPLAAAVTRPPVTPPAVPLAAWLKAHGLTYGIAGYFDSSAVTLQSGDQVQVRAVYDTSGKFVVYGIMTKYDWFSPSAHDANFVIADPAHAYPWDAFTAGEYERYFGRPAAIYQVADRTILIYRTNLLTRLPALAPPQGQ
jgi:hypothetical protein